MGSFANSIYVRSMSPQEVADAVQQVMVGEAYTPTDESLDEMSMQGMGGDLRGIDVSEPHGGWVCVLDSDLAAMLEFAPTLAARLETAAITVMVNDSDSWCYILYQGGEQVDAFDSSGALDGIDSLVDLDSIDPDFSARVSELHARLESRYPAEIRDIQNRMAAGQILPDDVAKMQAWMQTEWPRVMSELTGQDPLAHQVDEENSFQVPDGAADEPFADQDLQERIELLRPCLADGVTDLQVRQVLKKRVVFAEEVLAQFLELLGIDGFGANLSYRYAREYGDNGLAQAGWPFPWQFRFRNGSQPTLRIFG